MKAKGRVRPSKPVSAIGVFVGIAFICFGVAIVVPDGGVFGVFWTLMALVITGYHAVNLFSVKGVADEVVEFEMSAPANSADAPAEPIERRLARLAQLKKDGLVSEREYDEQRKRILNDI